MTPSLLTRTDRRMAGYTRLVLSGVATVMFLAVLPVFLSVAPAMAATPVPAVSAGGAQDTDTQTHALTDCAAGMLQSAGGYRLDFEQIQHLAALSTPLVSRGEVELLTDGSIRWQVRDPIDHELRIAVDGTVTASDGSRFEQPAIMALVRMLLTLDGTALASSFSIQGQCNADGWALQLTPTDELLTGLFARIDAAGSQRLTGVTLLSHSGDQTAFIFTDPAQRTAITPPAAVDTGAK